MPKVEPFELTEAELAELEEGCGGFCVSCREATDHGIEPDARRYRCDSCGRLAVYGVSELLLAGLIRLAEE